MRKVLITGVSSGIGRHACEHLINRGYFVFGSARRQEEIDELSKQLGDSFHGLLFDVTDEKAIERAFTEVSQRLDGDVLAALVNNAGVAVPGPLFCLVMEDLKKQMDVNLYGVFRVTNRFLPLLGIHGVAGREPGKIINISSVSGLFNMPFNGLYCISKHALESMNDVYRRELMFFGIDVIAIEPGPIRTSIWEKARQLNLSERFSDSLFAAYLERADKIIDKSEKTALPPEKVSTLIEKILKSRRPKARYLVHRKPWLIKLLTTFVPDRWVDGLVRQNFKKDRLRPF